MKIISGGQTGVDRAALDYAIATGLQHGGWCPAGRVAEDGPIDRCYQLSETNVRSYPARTRMNVADADATLILYRKPMGTGTALTMRIAKELGKPLLVVRIDEHDPAGEISSWLEDVKPVVLNVAGPRESGSPGIADQAGVILDRAMRDSGVDPVGTSSADCDGD